MSINWEMADKVGNHHAVQYADRRMTHLPNDKQWAREHIINAYFAGFMENAAEREALRQINERLQSQADKHLCPGCQHAVKEEEIAVKDGIYNAPIAPALADFL